MNVGVEEFLGVEESVDLGVRDLASTLLMLGAPPTNNPVMINHNCADGTFPFRERALGFSESFHL